jgi:hypothetical protein
MVPSRSCGPSRFATTHTPVWHAPRARTGAVQPGLARAGCCGAGSLRRGTAQRGTAGPADHSEAVVLRRVAQGRQAAHGPLLQVRTCVWRSTRHARALIAPHVTVTFAHSPCSAAGPGWPQPVQSLFRYLCRATQYRVSTGSTVRRTKDAHSSLGLGGDPGGCRG